MFIRVLKKASLPFQQASSSLEIWRTIPYPKIFCGLYILIQGILTDKPVLADTDISLKCTGENRKLNFKYFA